MVANNKGLYDHPDDHRKIHSSPIPSLGGLGIFGGFIVAFLVMAHITGIADSFQYYIAAFFVIFFFGIKDDVLMISPMKKLIGQLTVSAILMFKAGLLISNMHGFLSITTIDSTFSYFLTLFTLIVVINAFNLIDGIDGLAGTLSIVSISFFSVFFYLNNDLFFSMMGFTFVASLVAFLIYNYSPARIFMGDSGSMLCGILNAVLVIRFIETAEGSSHILPVLASPAMGFGILMIPLLDTLRVFGIRIIHGRSPFAPDRNHLHHILLDKGYSHTAITLTLSSLAIICVVFTYVALPIGTTKVIFAQVVIFFTGVYLLQHLKPKIAKLKLVKGAQQEEAENLQKVRNLVNYISTGQKVADNE
jgi:UDP-N-acetylmuramyl pentapeptide phosphotransferase/UDP-N-acetylglucosamine-1-phosphate transferase